MSQCDLCLKRLRDCCVVIDVQSSHKQITRLLDQLLITRILLRNSLASSGQSHHLVALLLRQLQLAVATHLHHLQILYYPALSSSLGQQNLIPDHSHRPRENIFFIICIPNAILEFGNGPLTGFAEAQLQEKIIAYLHILS